MGSKLPLLQYSIWHTNYLMKQFTIKSDKCNETMKRRGHFTKDPIKFLCVVVSVACTLVLCLSVLQLNEIPVGSSNTIKRVKINPTGGGGVGKLGEIVMGMLPQDLGFTLFLPSEKAFERDLGLGPSDLVGDKGNDTHAILTRVLGFSAVARRIYSDDVQSGKEIDYDSISGYTLYITKDSDGSLIVNRIASEMVNIRRGKIVVHVMDGVIMDSEFEQSVRPGTDEDD
ncbi:hypothetical protein RND71_030686 [Anisodus tanguticus]|uniref:FAS1 domain-containing protein n=1 Tax=Anisodus tanguticus TaxID=243964 RepID=A0AAE1RGV5_9SOLA|nr:hypothetical protein RND71_030686 [Anisodus tanguticus]